MALTTGTRLGPYDIVAPLGAGGMGEVYRARDSKLNRDVAIKVLLPAVANDPDRLARFSREAQVLASLNHPNIAHIHGLEEAGGVTALVLELVEGEDLAQRIARGPIPLDEALPIAKQIADALEAAHEQGIIHRDLKPANIKVRPDGTVKVLDFGLAKAMDPAGATSANAMNSPTLSMHATQAGIILGTAAYMSPEQARGKSVDRRADIWAFGCVLFEMLAGRQTFDAGETVSDAVASILKNDPDWRALPASTPVHVQTLLRRCLQKDPQKRLPHIGIARIEIDEGPATVVAPTQLVAPPRPLWRRALPIALTAIIAGAVVGATTWMLRPVVAPSKVTRFEFRPDLGNVGPNANRWLALSPDGTALAFTSPGLLNPRTMSSMDTQVVTRGTLMNPVFSPDGQWIVFWSIEGALKKVAVTGGAAVTLCRTDSFSLTGITWDTDRIYFLQRDKGLFRVSANGGEPELIVPIALPEVAMAPQILDHGGAVLLTVTTQTGNDRWDKAQVIVQPLPSGPRKVVFRGASAAQYVPSGHLVYALGSALLAVPFDLRAREVRGGPVPLVAGVMTATDNSGVVRSRPFAVSASGSLAYLSGTADAESQQLALMDRSGKAQTLSLPAATYTHPRFSPDGKQLTYSTDDGKEAIVWVYDVRGGAPPRRLTFGGNSSLPIWTPNGRRITFRLSGENSSGIYWQAADGNGAAELLLKAENDHDLRPESWSSDGKTLAFLDGRGSGDIYALTLGADQKPKPLVQTSKNERYAAFSPDDRWFAYSVLSAPPDSHVFVEPYPQTGAKYQFPANNVRNLVWSADGKQVFVNDDKGRIQAVDISTRPSFSFGKPSPFPLEGIVFAANGTNYDVSPDGKQFVVVMPAAAASDPAKRTPPQINVVLNWIEELKQRVPTK